MKPVSDQPSQKSLTGKQPEYRQLIRELRQLMQLTQVQLGAELGVTYETINRWQNGHMQPSPLALRQIRAVLERLQQSPSKVMRDGSQVLLQTYFPDEQEKR